MYDNLKICFSGTRPSASVLRLVKEVADKIQSWSPSDSCLQILCETNSEDFKASCRIVSKAGVFCAEAADRNPRIGLKKLEGKIQKQLDRWKKSRTVQIFGPNVQVA